MKLWTVQPKHILKEIETTGTYRCRKEFSFNLSKADSLDTKYQWLMERMETRIGKKPEGVEYPIWAWHTWVGERRAPESDSAAFLKRTEDKVLLTLEIPDEEVVLTDFDAWQVVLNDGYLSNEQDPEKLEELMEHIDTLEKEDLQKEIEESWETVFDLQKIHTEDLVRGEYIQATFWELKKEYIREVCVLEAQA